MTVYHNLFILSPIGRHLGCFKSLANINNTAPNDLVPVLLCMHASVSV